MKPKHVLFGGGIVCALLFFIFASVRDFSRDAMVDAARSGDTHKLSLLLALGADPSRVGDEEHLTPLGASAGGGHIEAVRCLLRSGADVRRVDDYHRTPLELARAAGQNEIAVLLEQAAAKQP